MGMGEQEGRGGLLVTYTSSALTSLPVSLAFVTTTAVPRVTEILTWRDQAWTLLFVIKAGAGDIRILSSSKGAFQRIMGT